MIDLMYITNKPEVAKIVEAAGVDTIFVDLEVLDKNLRQCGMDTVQSHHTIEDVKAIHDCLTTAKLLVRINHIYQGSKAEIDAVLNNGADIVMLPYFKTLKEVHTFIDYVGGRAKICLLLETKEAAEQIDRILEIPGIDIIYIGLNDLHLSYGMKFIFEPLANGLVESLSKRIKEAGITFGFGGLARLDSGLIPGKWVLKEHYRLGSSMVIVSRSFCNSVLITDLDEVRRIINEGIAAVRHAEKEIVSNNEDLSVNQQYVIDAVASIVNNNLAK